MDDEDILGNFALTSSGIEEDDGKLKMTYFGVQFVWKEEKRFLKESITMR